MTGSIFLARLLDLDYAAIFMVSVVWFSTGALLAILVGTAGGC